MELKNQVCTIEQAKRLIALGLFAPSAFVYFSTGTHSGIALGNMYMRHIWILTGNKYEAKDLNITPAYTGTELGVMLDDFVGHVRCANRGKWRAKFKPTVPVGRLSQKDMEGIDTLYDTEAQARAALLIHMLETDWLDAGECNERLN